MASPQLEDGYTRLANDLVEALARTDITGCEFRVALAVIRDTYGWNRKEATIGGKRMAKLTGIEDRAFLSRLARQLQSKGIITRVIVWGLPARYTFNKDYTKWLTNSTDPRVSTDLEVSTAQEVHDSTDPAYNSSTDREVNPPPPVPPPSPSKDMKDMKGKVLSSPDGSDPPPADDPPTCGWCSNPKTQTAGVPYLQQQYHDRYLKAFGKCPKGFVGIAGSTFKHLLTVEHLTDTEIVKAIDNLLLSDAEWVQTGEYSVSLLRNNTQKFLVHPARPLPSAPKGGRRIDTRY